MARFAPDGTVDQVVPIPASQVTSCAFGGEDLKTALCDDRAPWADGRNGRPLPAAGRLFAFKPPSPVSPVRVLPGELRHQHAGVQDRGGSRARLAARRFVGRMARRCVTGNRKCDDAGLEVVHEAGDRARQRVGIALLMNAGNARRHPPRKSFLAQIPGGRDACASSPLSRAISASSSVRWAFAFSSSRIRPAASPISFSPSALA